MVMVAPPMDAMLAKVTSPVMTTGLTPLRVAMPMCAPTPMFCCWASPSFTATSPERSG